MTLYTFHCPHCGGELNRVMKIVWSENAPCPKCNIPVKRNGFFFYYNCFEVGMCYTMLASLTCLVVNCMLYLVWPDTFKINYLLFILTAFLGGPLLGVIFGTIMSLLVRPILLESQANKRAKLEAQPQTNMVKCIECKAVSDRNIVGEWCECGKKLPKHWIDM